ncbi:MAG: type I methionyl aminopeptidase [Minisyncoccia bacterium]
MNIRIKTLAEIRTLREGGRRHAQILKELVEMVRPGVSTNELNEYALKRIKEYGDVPAFLNYKPEGARRPYPAALCVSINDEIVHGVPNEKVRILNEGDIVSLDLGVRHEGLITDSAITVGVGKISHEDEMLLAATERALFAGIDQALMGGRVGDIGAAVEKISKRANFKICEGLAGHGVGFDVHEDPYIPNTGIKGDGPLLKDGMVIAIEPMFTHGNGEIISARDGFTYKTADGKKSAHFEHTVAITKDGPIILTSL